MVQLACSFASHCPARSISQIPFSNPNPPILTQKTGHLHSVEKRPDKTMQGLEQRKLELGNEKSLSISLITPSVCKSREYHWDLGCH